MSEFIRFKTQCHSDNRLYLAYSGGLDSTVLLHLLATDSDLKDRVYALHVNHHLQPESSHWAEHCAKTCQQFKIPFQSLSVEINCSRRQGIESVARNLRYTALKGQLSEGDTLLTAHHQRDQAETFLLNLSRGAGVHGLSAMPECKRLNLPADATAEHKRPLLRVPYPELLAYAEAMGLNWISDPSNENCDFRRNLIRHRILPEFEQAWPNISQQIARSAEFMQEAQTLMDKNARIQLQQGDFDQFYIDLNDLMDLDWVEQKNVLRFWAKQVACFQLGFQPLQWIEEHLHENNCVTAMLQLPMGELRLYRKKLYYLNQGFKKYQYNFNEILYLIERGSSKLKEQKERCFKLELPHSWLTKNKDRLKLCSLQENADISRKKLKKWFQSKGIPQWQRDYWPVLTLDGKPVAIWGIQASFVETDMETSETACLRLTEEQIHQLSTGHFIEQIKAQKKP
ncbi:tRNA lysidine(34) synthetase TilS [Thiomicrorhabdus chilensis]|uniref:tRNA lysidine(34) synthetase TilS n=1 Tax=Thiomicrorhabdus chilensis TaxID=63656 RepID=UPI0004061B87|nr:tRNA lysidine(34) synthetase TilS [Thiomicrorhabdus chilensis]